VILWESGEGDESGGGLRDPVQREPGMRSPVHARKQIAHVDALHLVQTKAGLDLRPTVRWHDMHLETLEGFGEASKTSGGDTAVTRFDKTRRRLRGGCFIDMERWME